MESILSGLFDAASDTVFSLDSASESEASGLFRFGGRGTEEEDDDEEDASSVVSQEEFYDDEGNLIARPEAESCDGGVPLSAAGAGVGAGSGAGGAPDLFGPPSVGLDEYSFVNIGGNGQDFNAGVAAMLSPSTSLSTLLKEWQSSPVQTPAVERLLLAELVTGEFVEKSRLVESVLGSVRVCVPDHSIRPWYLGQPRSLARPPRGSRVNGTLP